jgi:hypothetical protein
MQQEKRRNTRVGREIPVVITGKYRPGKYSSGKYWEI